MAEFVNIEYNYYPIYTENTSVMPEFDKTEYNYPTYTGPHYNCCYCHTLFISEEFLNKHQKKCIQMKLHLILKMNLQLRRNTSTDDNQTKRGTTEDYFCEECLCGFLKLPDFECHMQEHHAGKTLFQSGDSEKNNLENNLLGMNSLLNENNFVCNQCFKRFPEKWKLKRHSLIHSVEKPFVCDQCDNRFSDKWKLKRHLIVHSGEKPFVCDQCDKRFSRKSHLTKHLLWHSGEKPFVCDQCDKRFSDKSTLKNHLLSHSGEKPFVCNQCDKRFSENWKLRRHLNYHSGKKRFPCDQCDKYFPEKWKLESHSKIHSGIKPFPCDHCEKRFAHRCNLRRHLKTHV